MVGSSPRHPSIVAALVRRIGNTDAATLTNAAWFAARRGELASARACAHRATALPGDTQCAHRALALLDAGTPAQLLLALPTRASATMHTAAAHGGTGLQATSESAVSAPATIADGRALLEAGRVVDSLAVFDGLARRKEPDVAVLFHRGVALAKMRRYRDAIQDWHAIERGDPAGPLGAVSRRLAASARRLADLFTGSG